LTLDVTPTQATLGFSNPWYPHAHKTAVEHVIDASELDPLTIRVISASRFIATSWFRTKIVATAIDIIAP
jgi:hypothetical protein